MQTHRRSKSRRPKGFVQIVGLCLATLIALPLAAEDLARPAIGLILDGKQADRLPTLLEGPPEREALVLLTASWDGGPESERDWSELGRRIAAIDAAGFRPALRLTAAPGVELPGSDTGESFDRWLGFVRSAVRRHGERLAVVQIGDRIGAPSMPDDPARYAFLLKHSALAARAEAGARGFTAQVAQAAVSPDELELQRALWDNDVAAYIDVLPVVAAAGTGGLGQLLEEIVLHPPAATVWVHAEGAEGFDRALEALAAGAGFALVSPEGSAEALQDQARWAVGVDRLLAGGYAPAPLGDLTIEDPEGRPLPGARVLARFLSDADLSTLIFYRAPGEPLDRPRDLLVVDSSFVRNTTLLDPVTGEVRRVGATDRQSDAGKSREIRIARADLPMAVRFEKVAAGLELPPQEVETAGTRELTAEEIIARHQAVQEQQDDRLERWIARGRIDFHFKLATGGASVDVSVDSKYFWERGGQLEWEQTDYYINGNKVRWKKIPELPLIQPEKVITLPLDLTLDRTYGYRLVGRDRVKGRDAYTLEFQPVDPDAPLSLYRGRVWIDVETFVRVKASVIQTRLESPVLANEEIDRFGPHDDADGVSYWMMESVDGQQTWVAAGRTFVVRREVTFSSFEINPKKEEFDRQREASYNSQNQMLRDTDSGFRYLERQDDGSRIVKEGVDSSQLFAAVGAFDDASNDGVTPLGGVNYFNYDLMGKNIQVNAFFAGVLGFFTASKPDLFGGRMDGTIDAALVGIKFEDQVFAGDVELQEETLRTRNQNVAFRLGLPVGEFLKLNFVAGVKFKKFFDEDDANDAIDDFNQNPAPLGTTIEFVRPQDHTETNLALEAEFNRRGYSITGSYGWAERSEWKAWGLLDTNSSSFGHVVGGSFVAGDPEPLEEQFSRWQVTAFKEWYLPKFQKIRGTIDYLDGSRMDRFSQYEFSFFGNDRLNGFSGTGVRFDTGWVARAGYSFNLFEVIRLDAALESAWVETEDSGIGTQNFSGIGLSGNVVGPWKTVISLNYGYALQSDIPDLEGDQEFLLVVLKLF